MRHAPTSGRIFSTAAAIVALALFGCATTNGDAEDPTEAPTTEEPDESTPDDTAKRPEFEASIDSSDAGTDPTPPNGDQCIDKDDPGSAENVAKELPSTTDCDNDYKEVAGVMKGTIDVDFYKLSATDENFCSLDTDFEAQTAGTELCVYARCKNSTVDAVTGCEEGSMATSEIGMKGCCAAAPGRAVPQWDCSGITDDDSADFFIRVKPTADKCLPYKFRYRY